MEFQKLKVLNFSCVRSLDWKVSLEKNIPPGTMIAETTFMKKIFFSSICIAICNIYLTLAIYF